MSSDMAGMVLFLCSSAGSYVSGQHILLDGGSTLVYGKVAPQTKL